MPTPTVTFVPGSQFSISLGGATSPRSVCVSMLHAGVVETSEKAVCIQAYNERGEFQPGKCWLPRAALKVTHHDQYGTTVALAKWFRLDTYKSRFFERHAVHAGLSV